MPNHSILSETARLRACITCAPGVEFDYMMPGHIEPESSRSAAPGRSQPSLLFDDLVLLPLLQAEHAELVSVIRAVTGAQGSLDLRDLARHVLSDARVAADLVLQVIELEQQAGVSATHCHALASRLRDLASDELVWALFTGIDPVTGVELLRCPMPNPMFSRDCWAFIGDAAVVGWPRPSARKRDGILARVILEHHPLFRGTARLDVRGDKPGLGCPEDEDQRVIEGGDILVAADDTVLVGIGERTSEVAAGRLAEMLWRRGIRRVIGVYLPKRRATMHLDTVLTFVDHATVLVHEPTFSRDRDPQVRIVDLAEPGRDLGHDLVAILRDLGLVREVIACGGGNERAAAREQWSDGANAFCLGPGRIVLYARNEHTLRALNRAGFEVLAPWQFVANAQLLMQGSRRLVVALPGAELSRGRGGPRCLTLPLARADEAFMDSDSIAKASAH